MSPVACSEFEMRRISSLIKTTLIEVAQNPLALLLTLSAAVLCVLSPALHYHQFGEPSRMARDAGFSAILIFGLLHGVFSTVKIMRDEIESGTMQMALSHSISRAEFYLGKLSGIIIGNALFVVTIAALTLVAVNGADIAAAVSHESGTLRRISGAHLVAALSVSVVSPVIAAILNRFFRFRFVLSATMLCLAIAIGAFLFLGSWRVLARFLPAFIMVSSPLAIFIALAGLLSVANKGNIALSWCGAIFLFSLPALGNYQVSSELAYGGTVGLKYFMMAEVGAAIFTALFVYLGILLIRKVDIE